MTWPEPSGSNSSPDDLAKVLYSAQVSEVAAQLRDDATAHGRNISEDWEFRRYGWELDKADATAEHTLQKSIHDARIAIATGAIDRAYKGAEFIRLSAGIIATVYTGIAGLAFAAKDSVALPARGVIPGVFLGLALVLSTAYAAWLTETPKIPRPKPHSSLPEFQDRRLNAITAYASGIAFSRAYALHAAVLSLGAGAVLLPTPFVDVSDALVVILGVVFLGAIFLVPVWTTAKSRLRNKQTES